MSHDLFMVCLRVLMRDVRKYVDGSLPTHMPRNGEADRQKLLARIDEFIDKELR